MICAQLNAMMCVVSLPYRLLRYDPLQDSTEVLLENLRLANGVQLSRDDDFVLVAETFGARIMKLVYDNVYIN